MKFNKSFFILLILITLVLIFLSCQKIFLYGVRPQEIAPNIEYETGTLHLQEEKLDVRYLVSMQDVKNNNGDMIFYFHGIGRTELDWIDSQSFGVQYYKILQEYKELEALPVVSISFGLVYVINDDLPAPFKTDLEKAFLKDVLPFFRKKLNRYGKIYIIAHSLGAFNGLILSLRHSDIFPVILAASPFIAPYSPFDKEFVEKMAREGFDKSKASIYEKWLTAAYKTKERWDSYNPYDLVGMFKDSPVIFLSYSKHDYPGFEGCIKKFKEKIESNKLKFYFSCSQRGHKSINDDFMYLFLSYIKDY